MGVNDFLKKMERKFAWSVFGVALAILTLLLPVIYSKKAELTFDIINQANVLDIRKSLKDITILFQGNNIYEKNQNLRIYQFKIVNSGDINITQKDYDQDEAWGFDVVGGVPIEARTVSASSDYLQKKINPLIVGNVINFNKVIFDKGSYFVLDVLVLHPKDSEPTFVPLGKIAGVEKINVLNSWIQKDHPAFFQQVFSGGVLINAVRFLVSLLSFIILLVAIVFLVEKVGGFFRVRKRKKILGNAPELGLDDRYGKILSKIYLDGGDYAIQRVYENLKNEVHLSIVLKKLNLSKQSNQVNDREFDYLLHHYHMWEVDSIADFVKDGSVTKNADGTIYVDPKLLSRSKTFFNVLRKIRNKKKKRTGK